MIENNKKNLLLDTLEHQSDAQKTKAGWTEESSDWNAPSAKLESTVKPAALLASNLQVNHGSKMAIKDVSFTLKRGDTLGLLGLNGAGKSTLLNVFCLLYTSPSPRD